MHFYYMTYMATPQLRNPCSKGHEIYNFGRPFLGHHYYNLRFVWTTPFKEIMHFHYMTYMAKFGKVLEKMLTHDRCRTMDNTQQQTPTYSNLIIHSRTSAE